MLSLRYNYLSNNQQFVGTFFRTSDEDMRRRIAEGPAPKATPAGIVMLLFGGALFVLHRPRPMHGYMESNRLTAVWRRMLGRVAAIAANHCLISRNHASVSLNDSEQAPLTVLHLFNYLKLKLSSDLYLCLKDNNQILRLRE